MEDISIQAALTTELLFSERLEIIIFFFIIIIIIVINMAAPVLSS